MPSRIYELFAEAMAAEKGRSSACTRAIRAHFALLSSAIPMGPRRR